MRTFCFAEVGCWPTRCDTGLLNTSGGLLAGTAAVLYGAWPSAASNFAWALIGLVTVFTATKKFLARRAERGVGAERLLQPSRYESACGVTRNFSPVARLT